MERFVNQDFVIQEHVVSDNNIHLDLRIKRFDRDCLESFVIPRQNFPINKQKFLALKMNNHNLSFLDIKGFDGKGSLYSGKIKTIQRGKLGVFSWTNNNILFIIFDKQFKGEYLLSRMKSEKTSDFNKWILLKKN